MLCAWNCFNLLENILIVSENRRRVLVVGEPLYGTRRCVGGWLCCGLNADLLVFQRLGSEVSLFVVWALVLFPYSAIWHFRLPSRNKDDQRLSSLCVCLRKSRRTKLYLHETSLDQQIDSSMITEITWATRCTVQTIQPRYEDRARSWQAHTRKGRPRLNSTSSSHSCQTASCSGWENDLIAVDSVEPFK